LLKSILQTNTHFFDETRALIGNYPTGTVLKLQRDANDTAPDYIIDLIDTEQMVRDVVLLGLPLAPLCQEDCRGLCPECGERWAELAPDHSHETLDARWAALQGRLASSADSEADAEERR